MLIFIEINACSEEQCLANGINQRCLWNILPCFWVEGILPVLHLYTEKKGENKKVKEKTGSDFCYI